MTILRSLDALVVLALLGLAFAMGMWVKAPAPEAPGCHSLKVDRGLYWAGFAAGKEIRGRERFLLPDVEAALRDAGLDPAPQ